MEEKEIMSVKDLYEYCKGIGKENWPVFLYDEQSNRLREITTEIVDIDDAGEGIYLVMPLYKEW